MTVNGEHQTTPIRAIVAVALILSASHSSARSESVKPNNLAPSQFIHATFVLGYGLHRDSVFSLSHQMTIPIDFGGSVTEHFQIEAWAFPVGALVLLDHVGGGEFEPGDSSVIHRFSSYWAQLVAGVRIPLADGRLEFDPLFGYAFFDNGILRDHESSFRADATSRQNGSSGLVLGLKQAAILSEGCREEAILTSIGADDRMTRLRIELQPMWYSDMRGNHVVRSQSNGYAHLALGIQLTWSRAALTDRYWFAGAGIALYH